MFDLNYPIFFHLLSTHPLWYIRLSSTWRSGGGFDHINCIPDSLLSTLVCHPPRGHPTSTAITSRTCFDGMNVVKKHVNVVNKFSYSIIERRTEKKRFSHSLRQSLYKFQCLGLEIPFTKRWLLIMLKGFGNSKVIRQLNIWILSFFNQSLIDHFSSLLLILSVTWWPTTRGRRGTRARGRARRGSTWTCTATSSTRPRRRRLTAQENKTGHKEKVTE